MTIPNGPSACLRRTHSTVAFITSGRGKDMRLFMLLQLNMLSASGTSTESSRRCRLSATQLQPCTNYARTIGMTAYETFPSRTHRPTEAVALCVSLAMLAYGRRCHPLWCSWAGVAETARQLRLSNIGTQARTEPGSFVANGECAKQASVASLCLKAAFICITWLCSA